MMTIGGVKALVLMALTTGLSGAAYAEGCGQDATQFVDGPTSTQTKARTKMRAGYLDCAEGDVACPLPPK